MALMFSGKKRTTLNGELKAITAYYLRQDVCESLEEESGSSHIYWQINKAPFSGSNIVKVFPNDPKFKPGISSSYGKGFMKKSTKLTVSADLVIPPMNSSSAIGLLKKLKVDCSDLEENQINISREELISILTLRASLISSSALTNGLSSLLVKKPKKET
ncbi:unnamed protein product [Microthlaspi erraticum]|uniref:Uncharacterized protein n=1 Tax=Microthlaspi erraticum TaxID=1685480 RepID=A0A6D2K2X2_9BRAS|nr:unnamed protein product [Microthlaspi erraticum]